MFNEAFMFFWLVSVVENIVGVFVIFAILCAGIGAFCAMEFEAYKSGVTFIIGSLFFIVCAVVTPPKESFYAGAAQYVGEAGELDQTLIDLKKLLDQKIAELADEEAE